MERMGFKLIIFVILYSTLLSSIEAQNLPKWVVNYPKSTNDTINIVMVGSGETLDIAKERMYGDLILNTGYNSIALSGIQIDEIELGGNIFFLDFNWGEWFNDNAQLIDEFSIRNNEIITYYAHYAISREAYNSLFDSLIYWFIPALKPDSIDNAIYVAANQLVRELPKNAKVAVLSFASSDNELGEFILEEITGYLSSSGVMNLFDRISLDSIRKENNFQMTGDVDDTSAISIGQFAGADIVITGSITGYGSTRRLRFKALDVKTASILSQTSHRF